LFPLNFEKTQQQKTILKCWLQEWVRAEEQVKKQKQTNKNNKTNQKKQKKHKQ